MTFKTIETQILEEVVDRALANGWAVNVNDGEETTVLRSRDRAQILNACRSTDSDVLVFWEPDGRHGQPQWKRLGWVWLIWGNGHDLISDYAANPAMDAFIEPIEADLEKAGF